MNYKHLIALLPCHSLDDFPFHLEGKSADDILTCYTVLWHPRLLAKSKVLPTWRRNDSGDDFSWEGSLVTLPKICRDDMPGYWLEELRNAGARVLDCEELGTFESLLDTALDGEEEIQPEIPSEVSQDFLALGLCHLLTEVLTVRMRYSSLLDGDRFSKLLFSAADAAVVGDTNKTQEMLGRCHDALAEAKDHFYPVDTFLFDLILVAPTTTAQEITNELLRSGTLNMMITARDLQRVTDEDPELTNIITSAIEEDRLCLVGGAYDDQVPLGILSSEHMLAEFYRGLSIFDEVLGMRPSVYGRRTFGLHPQLPQVLQKLDYIGALHQSLDGTRCPESYHGAISWQSIDGSGITALARLPLDAAVAESVLRLPRELGEAMDHDHVAAIGFAHYPGDTSRWYQWLSHIASRGSVLGKFVSLSACFRDAELMTGPTQFDADDYRTPYLRSAAVADMPSVSPMVASHRVRARQRAEAGVRLIETCVSAIPPGHSAIRATCTDAVFRALPDQGAQAGEGILLVNPCSQAETTIVDVSFPRMPKVGGVVKAAAEAEGLRQAVVEVPAMGFAWLVGDGNAWQPSAGKPLVETNLLRNEFLEAYFNPDSGALQSLHVPGRRGNLLSQRITRRSPAPGTLSGGCYAQMVVESTASETNGPFAASQTIAGRLVDAEQSTIAHFRQRVSVARGAPLLAFDLQLNPVTPPEGNPWQSYYGVRFAWTGDEIFRGVGLVRQRTFRSRIEAPDYLDLRSGDLSVTLLPGGIAYHLRNEPGQLDTILIPPGETTREFSWKIGLQLDSPAEASWSAFSGGCVVAHRVAEKSPAPSSAWLMHLSDPQVLITHVEFVGSGRDLRIRLRLLETGGRRSRLKLGCCRAFSAARKLDFTFCVIETLSPREDRVALELAPGELCLLELEFVG